MNTNSPIVSVCMISYNHEKYIAQSIDSVLMQKTNFDFEIVIGEDCSTDRTRAIILDYKAKHPDKIRLLLQEKNVGMTQNFIDTLKACKGKYIALLEGDDYWIDFYKLQKQVDFLEANPECVLTFHNRYVLNYDNQIEKNTLNYKKTTFFKEEIYFIHIPTLTVVFRNFIDKIPKEMVNNLIDASLFLFISQFGYFSYLDFIGAVYRQHLSGIWSGSESHINFTRSTKARLKAWKYLSNINRRELSRAIYYWISRKYLIELKEKKYYKAFCSLIILIFHYFYSRRLRGFIDISLKLKDKLYKKLFAIE